MDTFDVNEYSEKSREVLKKVVEEIREQFLVGGSLRQFWFYTVRIPDKTLTESVIQKWFEVLSSKGILHYCKLDYSELGQAMTFELGYLEKNYKWEPNLITQFILGFPPHLAPSFALDIYDTDLDKLISQLQKDRVWGRFSVDTLGRFYYDNTPLVNVNSSPLKKDILSEVLLVDDHMISVEKVEEIVKKEKDEGEETSKRRNRLISAIRKELRSVSHNVDIVSHKNGREVDYYELIISN